MEAQKTFLNEKLVLFKVLSYICSRDLVFDRGDDILDGLFWCFVTVGLSTSALRTIYSGIYVEKLEQKGGAWSFGLDLLYEVIINGSRMELD